MILLILWDGHLARPLYFSAGRMPTPQESYLDSATPKAIEESGLIREIIWVVRQQDSRRLSVASFFKNQIGVLYLVVQFITSLDEYF